MRLNKGNKVEAQVWTQDAAAPLGGWRGGEVTWGNGHSYTLRWFDGGPESDRIPRKSVRPCPPPLALPEDLAAGDMVEVLDEDCLWKLAEVVDAVGGGELDVKIAGSTRVVTAALDAIRVRQVLREDDVWVALHKGNEIPSLMGHKDGGKLAAPASVKKRGYMMGNRNISANAKRPCVKEEPLSPARYDDNFEVVYVNPTPTTPLTDQPRTSGEDCDVVGAGGNGHHGGAMPASSSSSSSGSSSDSSSSDSSSGDSDSSSSDDEDGAAAAAPAANVPRQERLVAAPAANAPRQDRVAAASATTAPRQDRLATAPVSTAPCQDRLVTASATSAPRQDRRHAGQPRQICKEEEHPGGATGPRSLASVRRHPHQPNPSSEVIGGDEGEHRLLQMHAYISLMKAFHAAGSLSWEKEVLLSDMRLQLNISCDEHLQVIRDLNGMGKPGRLHHQPLSFAY